MAPVYRFLNFGVARGVDGEQLLGRLFRDNSTTVREKLCALRFLFWCNYPWIIWSRTSSRPADTWVTSTFLRQAFFPFRLGCLYCAGAAVGSTFAMLGVRTCIFEVFDFAGPDQKSSDPAKIPR